MKIVVFSEEYPPEGGGAATVAGSFYSHLVKDEEESFSFFIGRYKARPESGFININASRKLWVFSYLFNIWRHRHLISGAKKIIVLDFWSSIAVGCFFSEKNLKKVTLVLHGSEPETIFNAKGLKKILRIPYNRLLRKCYRICAVSSFMKHKFLKKLKIADFNLYKIASVKIFHKHTGIADLPSTRSDEEHCVRKVHGIPENNKIVLTVSRIIKEKGFGYILDNISAKLGDDWTWVVVGDGPYLPYLKQEVLDKKLDNKVVFAGRKDKNELAKYYSESDVFVLISFLEEAFGLVYLESNYYGTPVVAANIGGCAESFENGGSGILHTLGDCLIKDIEKAMLLDKDRCIGSAGKYSYNDFYKSVICGKSLDNA